MENFLEGEKNKGEIFANEILEMVKEDQQMRSSGEWDNEVDQRNTSRLKKIIEEIGWPTKSRVGRDASIGAWLLVQHSDLDLEFQKECLALMKEQDENEVRKEDIAYLEDRVRVNSDRPTLYGSQFYTNSEGYFGPREIEDIENLDKRRQSVDLEPFQDYKVRMQESDKIFKNKKLDSSKN